MTRWYSCGGWWWWVDCCVCGMPTVVLIVVRVAGISRLLGGQLRRGKLGTVRAPGAVEGRR